MDAQDYDKLKLLHEQVEALTNSGTWELDLLENQFSWSDGVFKMLGYQPQEFEITFEKGIGVIHPEDRERATALLEEVLLKDAKYFIEKRLMSKAGNIVHVRSKATIFKDEEGKPSKLIGVFQDISDFVESQNDLKDQNSLTQDIIRDLPAVFFLFNQNGELLLWNKQLPKVTEYDEQEIGSKVVVEFFEGEEKEKVSNHIQEVLKKGYTELEAWLSTKGKGKVPMFISASTIQYKGERCIFGIGTDITERLSLLNELELLINNTEEAFTYLDKELNIVSFNEQMAVHSELFFQKRLEKGRKITQFVKPDQKEGWDKILKRVWEKNEVKDIVEINLEDDHQFYELKFKPIFSADGKINGVFLTSLNITEAQKANVALLESQQKLQQVLDSSLDTLCTIDKDGIFQMVSRSSEKLWGYAPTELVGKPFMDYVIKEDRAFTEKVAEKIQNGKHFRNFQNRYRHKEGHIVPVVWSAYWVPEQKLINCVARDATDQLKAEEQLKRSEKRFKALVQEGMDLIVILDQEGNYKYISPANEGSGFEPEDYIGKNGFDFIHPEDVERVWAEFQQLKKQKNIKLAPYRFLSSDGEWRWMESHITDLINEPSVQGFVTNSRDVSERIKAEQEIKSANLALAKHAKDLEISNAELEQFAYVASHDLQEPLRMISGFLSQLEKKYGDQLDEKAQQYIDFAVDGANRMRQIILDLLDYSKIGKTEEVISEVDLNEVVHEVCLLQRKKIEELGANIEFKNLPKIHSHPSPLVQIFSNLIANSLKYSHSAVPPKIIIRASELKNEWKISVKDNGIGIEEDSYDKIFNIFHRLHNKKKYSGTGMGLAIVKKIIERLNGRIWVKSDAQKGSTFYFTIPKS
ncbi:PAS domain S-box-containing protein [Marivirga sericea]|uniref:histidine kinase n=1 Tax=Marivirga sericea TaxID=1028 RepID=A0A1X7IY84_9BACT|nr:PAS domain S-box protein [Marivirga sericea]SMG20108.1 PAS domain S-box-containing protein [Marivirga sericea]